MTQRCWPPLVLAGVTPKPPSPYRGASSCLQLQVPELIVSRATHSCSWFSPLGTGISPSLTKLNPTLSSKIEEYEIQKEAWVEPYGFRRQYLKARHRYESQGGHKLKNRELEWDKGQLFSACCQVRYHIVQQANPEQQH